jgi:hypothetical protein
MSEGNTWSNKLRPTGVREHGMLPRQAKGTQEILVKLHEASGSARNSFQENHTFLTLEVRSFHSSKEVE